MTEISIPSDFTMGVATSAWQIEGDLAGRGRSTWDDFADRPGAIVDGATAEPACDHVHRLNEDLDLLQWLGVDAYRFSISWPRVMPNGTGDTSAAGLDFYDRLVDGLLARSIVPIATLYHWDLPSSLERAGGWTNRSTAQAFADYAGLVTARFADRVGMWATHNEPWCPAYLGYAAGIFAPGRTEPEAAFASAYHLMLSHGLAVEQMRAAGAKDVGIVLNLIPAIAETAEMEAAAAYIDALQNRFFLNLLAGREIPNELIEGSGSSWSFVRDEDRSVISTPIDWLGENYYTVMRIAPPAPLAAGAVGQDLSAYPGAPALSFAPRPPTTDMGWEIVPEGLTLALQLAAEVLPDVALWVTENGAATPEVIDDSGIHDPLRTEYLRTHITQVLTARSAGLNIRGYLAWSLLDNLEWASGWTKRFGIIGVDPRTGARRPKDSAWWYRELLAGRHHQPH
jgi:beta-glucosidase